MKSILIICNGPSTNQLNWEWLKEQKIDTFAMNNAYRKFEELDFYPTYYSCLDNTVIKSHKDSIQKLMNLNKIKKLFLHSVVTFEEHESYQPVVKLPQKKGAFFKEVSDISVSYNEFDSWMNTGSDSVQISLMMGYDNIYVIGADGYHPMTQQNKLIQGIVYEVVETPEVNYNYWFSNYLEKGDQYNDPVVKTPPGWNKTSLVCQHLGVRIQSMSYGSYFPKIKYEDFERKISMNIKLL